MENSQDTNEPVAWRWNDEWGYSTIQSVKPCHEATPLYTHPQPKREPLTEDEIAELMMRVWGCASIAPRQAPSFARAIERAHGIGGGA